MVAVAVRARPAVPALAQGDSYIGTVFLMKAAHDIVDTRS